MLPDLEAPHDTLRGTGTVDALAELVGRGGVVVLGGAGISTVNPTCYRIATLTPRLAA